MLITLGVDLDDTITRHPDFYKELMSTWKGKRYIITARPEGDRAITMELLDELGIKRQMHYDDIIFFEKEYVYDRGTKTFYWADGTIGYREQFGLLAGNHKVRVCKELGVAVMFDDNDLVVDALRNAGIYVLHADSKFGD